MDILIHLAIIVIIGLFFFLDKHSTTSNAMFVIILISLFGFGLTTNSNLEVVNYSALVKINDSYITNPVIDITNDGFGIVDVQSFVILVYWFFLVLAALNLMMGKKYMNSGGKE